MFTPEAMLPALRRKEASVFGPAFSTISTRTCARSPITNLQVAIEPLQRHLRLLGVRRLCCSVSWLHCRIRSALMFGRDRLDLGGELLLQVVVRERVEFRFRLLSHPRGMPAKRKRSRMA